MRLALGLTVALAGCQTAALAPSAPGVPPGGTVLRQPDPSRDGHVYIAVTTSTHYPSVERFLIVHGIPESAPDRVLGGYGGLVAVSPGGTLYTFRSYSDGGIYAFNPRGNKPVRRVVVGSPGHCGISSGEESEISALAADAQGYLYVALYTYAGALRPGAHRVAPAKVNRVPCNGVAIYAPDANGHAAPIQTIAYGFGTVVNAIAVDAQQHLFVADYPHQVYEYATPVQNPKRTRTFHTDAAAHVASLATDAAGDIFISNTNYGYKTGWIDVWTPSAKANGPPSSQIMLEGSSLHFLRSIAVRQQELFAADQFDSVSLYHALQNGDQSPFFSFTANDVSSVAVAR
jgi:hypothetical protein